MESTTKYLKRFLNTSYLNRTMSSGSGSALSRALGAITYISPSDLKAKMDAKAKRLKALKGMVPSILELDDGCKLCSRFDPEECACKGTKVEPELIEISDGHFARVNLDVQ